MPKKNRYISEEAALQFLERLLLYARTKRFTISDLCKKAGVSRMSYYRWHKERRIPADQILRISTLFGLTADAELLGRGKLNGPRDLWIESLSPEEFGAEKGVTRGRQIAGYGIVWLLSRLPLSRLQIVTELGRGDETNPTCRLLLESAPGRPVAHVDLAIIAGQFVYQAFRHPANGPPKKVFEGCADEIGLHLCLEYLRSFHDRPPNRSAGDFDKELKNELKTYFRKHAPRSLVP